MPPIIPGIPGFGLRVALAFGFGACLVRAPLVRAQGVGDTRRWLSIPPLQLVEPAALQPGGRLAPRSPPASVADLWLRTTMQRLEAQRRARWHGSLLGRLSVVVARPRPERAADEPPRLGLGVVQAIERYTDLGIESTVRLEFRSERFQNERCTPAQVGVAFSGCRARFPFPEPDPQFNIRAGGLLAERIHVDVDYDNQREFDANQSIRVYYQGLEDDIVQRLEVGNVSFEPPAFRYVTSGIPANNFGVNAEGQLGPLRLGGIFAEQKGDVVRDRIFRIGEFATQPVDFDLRDQDFETGRFFFAIDPADIPGFPAVDILTLFPEIIGPDRRATQIRVYRLRSTIGREGIDPNLGGIPAVAVRTRGDSEQRVGPSTWELLIEGRDYYVDPSGQWFVLRNRLSTNDFLAVSYLTAAGGRVGSFPAGPRTDGVPDTLELIHEPRRGAQFPTFRHEMRNAYRVGGENVVRSSVELSITVTGRKRPLSGAATYLGLLDVAERTDPTVFDTENRLFPRDRDPLRGSPLTDFFVVLPHLEPFGDDAKLLPAERNDSLYRVPTAFLFRDAPATLFTLGIGYDQSGTADRSSISLGGFQLRENSEQLFIGERRLVRGQDYVISYDIGLVTFLEPDLLFREPAEVRAQFEQRSVFGGIPPTSIIGLSSTYDLGTTGTVNLVGLFQSERSQLNRPPLGFEPQRSFVGGVNTNLHFRPRVVTDLLNTLPFVTTDAPSTLTVNAEIAASRPNTRGFAFVEEFESDAGLFLSLEENTWQIGSPPDALTGLMSAVGPGVTELGDANAVPLSWQNLVPSADPLRPRQLLPEQIDPTLRFSGSSQQFETVLYLTLHPDTVGGLPDASGRVRWTLPPRASGPRWRSMTQALSAAGVDFSRIEFLEVWVFQEEDGRAAQQGASIVFDFGDVLEDATDFSPDTIFVGPGSDTTFTGQHRVGEGVLDTERRANGVWNAALDDTGILGDLVQGAVDAAGVPVEPFPACEVEITSTGTFFAWGDLRARCTRRNGFLNTEDLNGDNQLDDNIVAVEERVLRLVLALDNAEFLVRDGEPGWKLYRLPFQVDAQLVGEADLRRIRVVRMTLVTSSTAGRDAAVQVGLARLRLVGARWLNRAETPLTGVSGIESAGHGDVGVSVIGTQNQDLGYTSPPGIRDEAELLGAGFTVGQIQINEQSLRLQARDLRVGERAEAFLRYTDQADRNFLGYRELRVWARGRGPGWEDGDLEFYVKVGKDEHNFYLYRTPIRTGTWEPEVIIDLEVWFNLRARIERAWLEGQVPSGAAECGGDVTAFVACDGPYVVHVRDPGTGPPNLAAVQELATGIFRSSQQVFIDVAELWVDDIRLGRPVTATGFAGSFDVSLSAADVFDASLELTRRDDQFRQLGEDLTYLADNGLTFTLNTRLDRFIPDAGFVMPFSVSLIRNSSEPFFLEGSDIRADALTAVRKPSTSITEYRFDVRRNRRSASPLVRTLIDPVSINMRYRTGSAKTTFTEEDSRDLNLGVDYRANPGERTIRGVPGFLVAILDALPGFLRNGTWAESVRASRLRINPARVRFRSFYAHTTADRSQFRRSVFGAPGDDGSEVRSEVFQWRNEGSLEFQPYRSLSFSATLSSTRDLRDYGDSTTTGLLTDAESRNLLGVGVGFERERRLGTSIALTPPVASWLQPRLLSTSSFNLLRNPNRDAVRVQGDTAGPVALSTAFWNSRRTELGTTVDWATLASVAFGDSSAVARLFRRVTPSDIRRVRDRSSSFDRAGAPPSAGFQLGLGGTDVFQAQEGAAANAASEGTTHTLTVGSELPLGFRFSLLYEDDDRETVFLRSQTRTTVMSTSREWPSGSLAWTWSPSVPVLSRALVRVGGQFQYRRRTADFEQPQGASSAVVSTQTRNMAPSLNLTWVEGVITGFRYAITETESVADGSFDRLEQENWSGFVTFRWRPPLIADELPNAIRTQIRVSGTVVDRCLQVGMMGPCESVALTERSEWGVQMDTDFPPNLAAGLSVSRIGTRERHLDQKFSQLTFTAFLQFSFFAGEFR